VTADGNAVRVSFNGGRRGTAARPTRDQKALLADARHVGATTEQQKHFELAAIDRSLFSKQNNGEPGVAATRRAGVLDGAGITRSSARTPDRTAQSGDEVTTGANARPVAVPEIEGAQDEQVPAAK
jgi:hypothetical protein